MEIDRASFTFPNGDYPPAKFAKRCLIPCIASLIRLEFGLPELLPGGWHPGNRAVFVGVPEAAVHHHNRPIARQYDIRSAREILGVEAKPSASRVQGTPHEHLRLCVFRLEARH